MFFFRITDEPRAENLRSMIAALARGQSAKGTFQVEQKSLGQIPGTPFAYWIPNSVRRLFTDLNPFESQGRQARQGASTVSAFRHLRLWWECPPAVFAANREDTRSGRRWVLFAKGGKYSPYYYDIDLAFDWLNDGAPVKAEISEWRGSRGWGYQWSATLNGHEEYLRPGLTWPSRTQSGLALRAMPAGCIFADRGLGCFVDEDSSSVLLALLAVANSSIFRGLSDLLTTFGSFGVGVVQRVPVPELTLASQSDLAWLAHRCWSLKRALDTCVETSHAFTLPALLQVNGETLADRSLEWNTNVAVQRAEFERLCGEINNRCFSLYGVSDEDRISLIHGFGGTSDNGQENSKEDRDDLGDEVDDAETNDVQMVSSLLSWAIGVVFGRFDVRLATEEWEALPEPDPFNSLPVCSPGMLIEDNGLPAGDPPTGYPIVYPWDGALVDDVGHDSDMVSRLYDVFERVLPVDPDVHWQEAAVIIDPQKRDLRSWLATNFFGLHIKSYSQSRRTAPIYWQIAIPSASYSVWLYYHRFTKDTFYKVLNDYVTPKLQHEERKLTGLMQGAGGIPTASQRKEIAEQEAFLEEIRAFRKEIAYIAPLWNPNLNDGVIINFAPLWRLVPHHRSWQKECKSCWDKLVAGDYDWAHLAMHLWPERVVPKCAGDRSLAIAHGLEEAFWVEDDNGKWQPRKVDPAIIDQLIKERTSAAVKDTLKSLLEAPAPMTKRSPSRAKGTRRKSSPRTSRLAATNGPDPSMLAQGKAADGSITKTDEPRGDRDDIAGEAHA